MPPKIETMFLLSFLEKEKKNKDHYLHDNFILIICFVTFRQLIGILITLSGLF
jgi:hypothetical protein